MNRRVTAARLLTLLCLMALVVSQTVGGFAAYLCDCGGEAMLTRMDHCHGPHSVKCHDHESGGAQQHKEGSGDRQDHERIVQELRIRSAETFQVPAVIPVLLTWMPEAFAWQDGRENGVTCEQVVGPDTGPPPSVTVARSVVFII